MTEQLTTPIILWTSAIIVLGYSLNKDGSLHSLLTTRLNKALSLYKPGMLIITTGKMPPAQLNPNRCEKITEAAAMKNFLVEKGIEPHDILMEEFSLTTFTNAFYTRIIHLDPMNIKTAYIVSNSFHMPLVSYCFELVFGNKINFELIAASNEGLDLKEIEIWNTIIDKLTTEIYPDLFKNVCPGDLEAIQHILNEATIPEKSPARTKFESQLRKLLSLEKDRSLKGIV